MVKKELFFFNIDGTVSEWKRILDVNVIALSVCSREAVRSMNSRNLADAHIIHLSRYRKRLSVNFNFELFI